MLRKRFLQLAWLHVIQAGVYREALEICRSSRMSTSISGQAGPGTRHLGGHAAGSGREAATVDLSHDSVSLRSLRMKKTMTSEIVQIEPW